MTLISLSSILEQGAVQVVPRGGLRMATCVDRLMEQTLGLDAQTWLHFSHRGRLSEQDIWTFLTTMRTALHPYPWTQWLDFAVDGVVQETRPLSMRALFPHALGDASKMARSLHRDTWYHLPRRTLNIWVPLCDADDTNSFEIFPECFQQDIPYHYAQFDAGAWARGEHTELPYAEHDVVDGKKRVTLTARRGDLVLFSGHHLHRTIQTPTRPRLSVDGRMIFA